MGRVKDLYIETLERMIEDYSEEHPGCSYEEAYDACTDGAYTSLGDRMADQADNEYKRKKEDGL